MTNVKIRSPSLRTTSWTEEMAPRLAVAWSRAQRPAGSHTRMQQTIHQILHVALPRRRYQAGPDNAAACQGRAQIPLPPAWIRSWSAVVSRHDLISAAPPLASRSRITPHASRGGGPPPPPSAPGLAPRRPSAVMEGWKGGEKRSGG